ncbi:MAG: hypothetical protein K2P93_00565 [Alphaproteobacteria bacterium]|nr:hypothetical protein [Alphaproteobacteria bacterium]
MKKAMMAMLVLGLSGTFLSAESSVDLSKLPPEVQANIKKTQERISDVSNPVQAFVNIQTANSQRLQNQYYQIVNSQGYLAHNPSADAIMQVIISYLKEVKIDIGKVKNTEHDAATTLSDLRIIPYLLGALEKIPPADAFPDKCYSYSAETIEGYIMLKMGNQSTYALYSALDNHVKPLAEISKDVGLIKNGKEYNVSLAVNSKVNAQLSGGLVVCLSRPLK